MKKVIALMVFVALLTGCSSMSSKPTANQVHEQSIGSVVITYDNDGWIKIVSTSTAPIHNKSTQAVAEASKIAALHAKAHISDFISNQFSTETVANTSSKSNVHAGEENDNDLSVLSDVVEHIRSNSNAVLRGAHVTSETFTDEYASVEVTITKGSVSAAQNIQGYMNGSPR